MRQRVRVSSAIAVIVFCLLPIRYVYTFPQHFVCHTFECPLELMGKNGQQLGFATGRTPVFIALYKTTFTENNGSPKLAPQYPIHDYVFIAFIAWLITYETMDLYSKKQQPKINTSKPRSNLRAKKKGTHTRKSK